MMGRIRVSDHAILKWLETVEGVNVDAIRRRIRKAVSAGAELSPRAVRVEGVTFYLRAEEEGPVVVTTNSRHPRPHLAEPRLTYRGVPLDDYTDAERYRFLRERDLDAIYLGGVFAGKTPDNLVLNGDDLDAAVDAARAAEA